MSLVFAIENRFKHSRLTLLFVLLIIKALIALVIIGAYQIRLSPDEAQYWTWSRHLDWGYYSKPPAIAWQIWFTTLIFGSNEFGVRFGAVVISFFIALSVYHLSQLIRLPERVGFWAALVMAFSPLGIFFSFAATTDGGMTLFLTLAIAEVARGLEEQKGPNYPLAGIWLLFGALYKWTAYTLWPVTLLMMLFTPRLRRFSFLLGLLISLLALLPSVYWNATHDWATFRHVGRTLYHTGTFKAGNIFDFIMAQIGILSPIFFIFLVASYFYIKRPSLIYLGLFPFLILFYIVSSFFKKMQPNWGDFLYPPGMVLVAWVALEKIKLGRVWLIIGIWLSILGTWAALSIPALQKHNLFSDYQVSYKANPFRQNMGWDRLRPVLEEAGYDPEETFLFADRYQTTSLLTFYGPHQKQAYFFNINKERKNHFSYAQRMEDYEVGKTGYFVLIENVPETSLGWYEKYYPEKIAPYFESIHYAGSYPLFKAYNKPVKHAIVFRCENYLGLAPLDPQKY